MTYIGITSDLDGNVYSIDHNGNLFLNETALESDRTLQSPGLGIQIGSNWHGVTRLAATRYEGFVKLLGITADNRYVEAATSIAAPIAPKLLQPNFLAQPAALQPQNVLPANRNLAQVGALVAGPNGAILEVLADGTVQDSEFSPARLANPGFTFLPKSLFSNNLPINIIAGESTSFFTNGEHYFDVTIDGEFRFFDRWRQWVVIDRGWSAYQQVFGADPSGVYVISAEGVLSRRALRSNSIGASLGPVESVKGASGFVGWRGLPCDVEGYSDIQSVKPGNPIQFMVRSRHSYPEVTEDKSYSMNFVRLKGVDAAGKPGNFDEPMSKGNLNGISKRARRLKKQWVRNGVNWSASQKHTIPSTWPSGLYAAKCTDLDNRNFYIPFVVRSAQKSNPFLVLANTNTWNAYNSWGGIGKYVHGLATLPGELTFLRPHPGLTPEFIREIAVKGPDRFHLNEIRNQSMHLLRAELWIHGFLDQYKQESGNGYDMITDRDLHDGVQGLSKSAKIPMYKALILTTHPEYWSKEMYERVKLYQRQGGSILYLGANGIYEMMKFKDKNTMLVFPNVNMRTVPNGSSNEDVRPSNLMRYNQFPERALVGVGFEPAAGVQQAGKPYRLHQSPHEHPMLTGVKLQRGDKIGSKSINPGFKVNGWEIDQRGPLTPLIARDSQALLAVGKKTETSGEMLFYKTGKGGIVFTGGSLNFGGALAVDKNLQKIVKNVLNHCLTL